MVVPVSESEINSVHAGQIASVTIEAVEGKKAAAYVSQVSDLPASSSSSSAVTYDVTFLLENPPAGVRIGMSATADVVVKQAEGVNVATSAIKNDTVTVKQNGSQVTRVVTTGLAGDSTTIVTSGLKPGEVVVLPTNSTSSSKTSSLFSSLRSRLSGASGASGAGGFSGGGFAGGGGGPPGAP